MVDGIVLAGGFSSRAKTNKMCFEYQGKALILHAIETMHEVCQNIIVVTGHYHNEISELLSNIQYVKIAYNKDYEKGMFSSILTGVKQTTDSFFIIPGDYPKIKVSTYRKILNSNGFVIVPSYQNRLGHPIYFDKSFKQKILITDHNNLKSFRNDYQFKIVDVLDEGILIDIDDLDDYKNLIGKD
ncbi:nucleotidyltransferase family protein [Mycoplasmatota bacterium WC30]